jgi:hypothetical protein
MNDTQSKDDAPCDRKPTSDSDQPSASNTPAGKRSLKVEPSPMGLRPGLTIDCTEALLEYAEGPFHR